MRTTLAVLAMLGTVGCSAAYRAARQGDEALERGDLDSAVAHYWSACRQSGDKEWCERADRFYGDLEATLLDEAKPVCGTVGEERRCLAILNRARRVKDAPRLAALADAAGATWLDTCSQPVISTPVDAVVRVRCVEALRSAVSTAAYLQRVGRERRAMADFVAQQAKQASAQGLLANSLGLSALTRCLSGDVEPPLPLDVKRQELVERLRVRTNVATDGVASAQQVCAGLTRLSNGRLSCASGSELGLRVGLTRSELTHDIADTVHDVTYVARRDVHQNPEWRRLDRLREQAEHRAREAKLNAKLAADDCEQARSDLSRVKRCRDCEARRTEEALCRRASTLDDVRREAVRELDDAERRVRTTDRELVTEVTDVYRYTRRTHTWRQNFRLVITSSNAALPTRDVTFEVARTGVEQPKFAPAGVEGRVARAPGQAELDDEALESLETALGAWVKTSLSTLARAKDAQCTEPSPGRALECRVASAFLRGEEPGRFYVAELGRDADRKAAYPAAACVP
ncbi:MAG: hypothetical protein JNJ54_15645 [Myxococcaceae bacterium]|nr:hypothetical protein [Myxococcaceae bacterium]